MSVDWRPSAALVSRIDKILNRIQKGQSQVSIAKDAKINKIYVSYLVTWRRKHPDYVAPPLLKPTRKIPKWDLKGDK